MAPAAQYKHQVILVYRVCSKLHVWASIICDLGSYLGLRFQLSKSLQVANSPSRPKAEETERRGYPVPCERLSQLRKGEGN